MKKLLLSINIILILILLVLIRYFKLILPDVDQSTVQHVSMTERERKRAVEPNDILTNYNYIYVPSMSLFEFSTQPEDLIVGGTQYNNLLNISFIANYEPIEPSDYEAYSTSITNFTLNISYTNNGVGQSFITNIATDNYINNYNLSNLLSVSINFENIYLTSFSITIELEIVIRSIDSGGMTYTKTSYPEYEFSYNQLGIETAGNTVIHKATALYNTYFYDNSYLLYLLNYYGFEFYDLGAELAYSAGYNAGLLDGDSGFNFEWLSALFDTANQVLNFEIIAGLKLWYVIGIPALFSLVYMLLKLFR